MRISKKFFDSLLNGYSIILPYLNHNLSEGEAVIFSRGNMSISAQVVRVDDEGYAIIKKMEAEEAAA